MMENNEYSTVIEEGISLSPYTQEFTAYIQECFDYLEKGEEDRIYSDPFYVRDDDRPMLTDEEIDKVIDALDQEFEYELGHYPGYHRNRSGANALPEFRRMSPRTRRAMVEGIDRIIAKYRRIEAERVAEYARIVALTPPPVYVNEDEVYYGGE